MPKIRDILSTGVAGIIPKMLADQDGDRKAELDRLMGENESLKNQMAGAQGAQPGMKKGGKVKAKASSASKRADGCAQRGKTRGKFV